MKNALLLLLVFTSLSCSNDDNTIKLEIPEATLVGRWDLIGFEGNVLYEFTEDKRFTLYSADGEFGTIQELIEGGILGNDYWYEEEKVTIDLNFGNSVTLTPQFKCNNNVVNWLDNDDEIHSTMSRTDYDYELCIE